MRIRIRRSLILRQIAALVLVFVAWSAAAAAQEVHDLELTQTDQLWTLEEMLARAESMSPTVHIADARIGEADARLFEARMARMPSGNFDLQVMPAPHIGCGDQSPPTTTQSGQLNGQTVDYLIVDPGYRCTESGSGGQTNTDLFRSIFEGFAVFLRAELDIIVPISTFGKVRFARRLAQVGVDAARAQAEAERLDSRHQTYRAYVTVQWHEAISEVLRDAERQLNEAEQALEDRLDDGDRSARSTLRELTLVRATLVEGRAAADGLGLAARYALRSSLRLPPHFQVTRLDDTIPPDTPGEIAPLVEAARQNRLDVQLLDYAVRARETEVRLRRHNLAPDLYFAARVRGDIAPTVERIDPQPFESDPFNGFGVGLVLGLRWRLDVFTKLARISRAEAQLVTAERQRDGALVGIEADLAQSWLRARGAHDVVRAHAAAMRASKANLDQRTFQYDQGLLGYEELAGPLQTYYDTVQDYYQALLRYRLHVADLATNVGADDLTAWPTAETLMPLPEPATAE